MTDEIKTQIARLDERMSNSEQQRREDNARNEKRFEQLDGRWWKIAAGLAALFMGSVWKFFIEGGQ